ncbi:MAG: ATP-binding protein, partial [Ktedonobacterales bacterium]
TATGRQHPIAVAGIAPELLPQWWAETEAAPPLSESPLPEMTARLLSGEVVVLDLSQPPFTQPPFSEMPNPYGVKTALIAPMQVRDQLVGMLSLDHSGAPHHYTADEITLTQAVAKLSALVIERDRLLRERTAATSQALTLAEANRRMDDFLSMASHELRTPLTTLKANTQLSTRRLRLLSEGTDDTAQRLVPIQDLLVRADRQVDLLNRLVGDLLDMSRIQSQQLELRPEPADLAEIVHAAVREQRMAWPARTIAFSAPPAPVEVLADADRIGQVVSNYLTNALKYSTEDRPVGVHLLLEGAIARVSVVDRGPGLPLAEQQRIWERFHRTPGIEVLSGSGVGLGLGLHIGKTLIEGHGGQVGVSSVVGSGSTFWFTLPLARPDQPE